jgi:hypothetical protein
VGFNSDGALQALLAAVHWARAGGLAATGCLGDAPVHGQALKVQAEEPVIGGQHEPAQLLGQAEGDPLVAARRRVVAEQVWSAMRR